MEWELLWTAVALASPLIGCAFFLAFAKPYGLAHLGGLRDLARFFLAPYGPRLMLLVKDLAGRVSVYYDRDVSITKSAKGYVIDALGQQYVMDEDPEAGADLVSLADARGPVGMVSPFGLAWRALAGWAAALAFSWVALSATLIADVTLPQPVVTSWDWVVLIAFIVNLLLVFGVVMQRLYTPQTRLVGLVEYGVEPPYVRVAKGCSPYDSEPVDKCVARFGGKVVIHVPQSVKSYLDSLASKIGSHALSAALLALVDMVPSYRKSLAELRREQRTVKEMAREFAAAEFYRYVSKPTLGKVLFWALLVLIGVGIGYAIGSMWSVSTTPPPWWHSGANATAGTATIHPATPPTLTTHTGALTPASPPTITHTTQPKTQTITPAPAPTVQGQGG